MTRANAYPIEHEAGPDDLIRDPSQDPNATDELPRKDQDRKLKRHLSAMPTAKCDLSTHLGITIRWSAPPESYLPVARRIAIAGWRASGGNPGGVAGRDAADPAQLGRGGALC